MIGDPSRRVWLLGKGGGVNLSGQSYFGEAVRERMRLSHGGLFSIGTVPILDFRGLGQSRAQGHGELKSPHPCRVEAGGGLARP